MSVIIASSIAQQEQVATLGMDCRHDMDCSDHIKGSYCSLGEICECSPFYVMFNETVCLPCKYKTTFDEFRVPTSQTENFFEATNDISTEFGSNIDIPRMVPGRIRKQTDDSMDQFETTSSSSLSRSIQQLFFFAFSSAFGQRLHERRAVLDACRQQRLPGRSVSLHRRIPAVPQAHMSRS